MMFAGVTFIIAFLQCYWFLLNSLSWYISSCSFVRKLVFILSICRGWRKDPFQGAMNAGELCSGASQHGDLTAFSWTQLRASVPVWWEHMSCLEFWSDIEATMPAGKEVLGIPWFSHQQVGGERRDTQSCKPVSICKINEANLLPLNFRAEHGAGKGWPCCTRKWLCAQNMHTSNLRGSQKCYCCV